MNVRVPTLMVWLLCSAEFAHAAADRAQEPAIVPVPASLQLTSGTFAVHAETQLVVDDDAGALSVAHYFGDLLFKTRELRPEIVSPANARSLKKVMRFTLQKGGIAVDPESYQLEISSQGVLLSAQDVRGLFYGATTLWQILSQETTAQQEIRIPALRISDAPRLRWRGLMLDSAHQYQSVDFIKRYIDVMAVHKLNVLHWYLADDSAWRIEIRKYPKLATRGVKGAAYTQTQISEIVAYAAQRNVTIVPGITLPAHAGAMIAAYPHLGATGPTAAGDGPHLLNADETTFAFIGDVIDELAQLFPADFIHIGRADFAADEWRNSPHIQVRMRELGLTSERQLQEYFVQRVTALGREHQRRMIGWDQSLGTADPATAMAMSSRGLDGALSASAAGYNVVVGAFEQLDFNHAQTSAISADPLGTGAVVRLEDVYAFDPAPVALGPEDLQRLAGVQANVWTDQLRTETDVEVMTFPRAAALAEIAWSPYARQRWADFATRLTGLMKRYAKLGVHYSDAAYRVSIAIRSTGPSNHVAIELSQQTPSGEIRYTLDDSEPSARSPMYKDLLDVATPVTMRAATFLNGQQISSTARMTLPKDSLAAVGASN